MSGTDRYELLERVDLALIDLMQTIDPARGPSTYWAAAAVLAVGEQINRARQIFMVGSVRSDPHRPDP